jgi:3-oxoacid CoA-transferase subunit B
MGPSPQAGEGNPELINAGKRQVTALPGAAYFHHADSFAMIRGGHVDVAVLGAMEVSQEGDLANWMVPGRKVAGIGGAMDLATGAKRVIAVLTHRSKRGASKLVERCSLPLTALRCVDLVVTDLAVLAVDRAAGGFRLVECATGVSPDEVASATAAPLAR